MNAKDITLIISEQEFTALKLWAEAYDTDTELMASKILGIVLGNPEKLEAMIQAHARYRELEGFTGDNALIEQRILGRKEYRHRFEAIKERTVEK